MNKKKAAIIIVNWNGLKHLKNCFESLEQQTHKNFVVYFVDNGSIDDSVKYIRKNFPKTIIRQMSSNLGFAEGNNIGIREAIDDSTIDYIVCLNNDTILDKRWLSELIRSAEKNKKIGAVQSKIVLGDRKTLHSTGGILNKDFSSDSRDFLKLNRNVHRDSDELLIAIGCSFLIKAEVLRKTGLFDPFFFSYKEDDDLSIRIVLSGHKIMYCPSSVVYHFHSSTFGSQSPRKLYYNERNRIFNLLVFGNPLHNIYSIKRYLRSSKNLKTNTSPAHKSHLLAVVLAANIASIRYLPHLLKKRWNVYTTSEGKQNFKKLFKNQELFQES